MGSNEEFDFDFDMEFPLVPVLIAEQREATTTALVLSSLSLRAFGRVFSAAPCSMCFPRGKNLDFNGSTLFSSGHG
jgi:hypothetical protein